MEWQGAFMSIFIFTWQSEDRAWGGLGLSLFGSVDWNNSKVESKDMLFGLNDDDDDDNDDDDDDDDILFGWGGNS